MARFVILEHEPSSSGGGTRHWDFMLEQEAVLVTWALDAPLVPGTPIEGRSLPAHRKRYLDYQGPVSGDRGHVTQWDAGRWRAIYCRPGSWLVRIDGRRVSGLVRLTCCDEETQRWIVRLSSPSSATC